MARYRKKPVEIEAFQMGIDPRPDWFQEKVTANEIITYSEQPNAGPFEFTKTFCDIKTLEGTMRGDYADWIIKGVKGEIYPCKPLIFEMSYDKVDS